MIKIFHGDNNFASRNAFHFAWQQTVRQRPKAEMLRLDGDKISLTQLVYALESPSFLGEGRVLIIDGLFSRPVSREKKMILSRVISEPAETAEIVIWEPKLISPAQLKPFVNLAHCRIQEFTLSKYLFKLLDALCPGHGKAISSLFGKTIETTPEELVMFMIGRRITELILAVDSEDNLDGLRFDWQKQKLIRQAQVWKDAEGGVSLPDFHHRLLAIDEGIKTGAIPIDLRTQLDILFLSL